MEKIIIIAFIVSIFSSCNSSTKEIDYYKSGEIKRVAETKDGKRNGILCEYYEDGTLKSYGEWENGMVKGEVKHYYENGKLWSTSTYVNNIQVGEAKYFYENGKILEHQIYTDNGDLAYFIKYDSLDNIDTEAVLLIFDPKKDTVNIGENYEVKIYFGVDISGDVELLIGKFDEDYNLIDTIAVLIGNESKEFNYSVKSNKTGVNTVPILVHHVPNEGDTLSADGLIVKHTFFVKSPE